MFDVPIGGDLFHFHIMVEEPSIKYFELWFVCLIISMLLKTYLNLLNFPSFGNSLAVQWLGLHAFTAEGTGSTPCQGTKIP